VCYLEAPYLRCLLACLFVLAVAAHADITGRVVAVTDGDTIKVLDSSNSQHKARLTGIDAPEDRGRYESAEDEAKARKWGLWVDTNPINPYD
jgi:endonuclease YncB( thermonuclease family)